MRGMHDAGGTTQLGRPGTLFADVVERLCCHPAYRLLSLKSLPQMPPGSIDFTTFTWPAILRRLRQMQITGLLLAAAGIVIAAAAAAAAAPAAAASAAAPGAILCEGMLRGIVGLHSHS